MSSNNENKIVLATRTDKNSYDDCIRELEKRFIGNSSIEKIYIICDLRKYSFKIGDKNCEVIFDFDPKRATVFNKVIDKLNKDKSKQYHLLTFSKEVELQKDIKRDHITELIKELKNDEENLIVVGYCLRDNILKDNELKQYSNSDNGNMGIAYLVPWNTCAIWNRKFVYGKRKEELKFDEICEKENNQLGKLIVKVNNEFEMTDYEGMEDGLTIAKLVTNNPRLKYKLIKKGIYWNITGDEERIKKHKIKLARKNIVLSTFINIKGYSIDKLRKATS